MRRFGALLLALALLLTAAACAAGESGSGGGIVRFYYVSADEEAAYCSDSGILSAEERRQSELPEAYDQMLNVYFEGPVSATLRSPFPEGLSCLETSLDESVLTVILSEAFDQLSGISRSVVSGCIVQTLSQFSEITGVCLETRQSADAGREAQVLTATSFVFTDLGAVNTETTVRLYFADANGRYLVSSERQSYFEDADEIPAYVVNQLIAGPAEDGQLSTMPEGTRLLDLSVSEAGVCTVDFSSEFLYNRPTTGLMERMTVLSLVNSLTELEPVKSVRILVEGEPVGQYLNMDLNRDLVRDASAMDMVREGLNEVDATLYVRGCSNANLVPVPVAVRNLTQAPLAETLARMLTEFTEINGVTNPLPSGTALLGVQMHGTIRTVDFSSQLLACAGSAADEQLAIRAVTETMTSLDGVSAVRITVNGESDGFRYYPLDRLYSRSDFSDP